MTSSGSPNHQLSPLSFPKYFSSDMVLLSLGLSFGFSTGSGGLPLLLSSIPLCLLNQKEVITLSAGYLHPLLIPYQSCPILWDCIPALDYQSSQKVWHPSLTIVNTLKIGTWLTGYVDLLRSKGLSILICFIKIENPPSNEPINDQLSRLTINHSSNKNVLQKYSKLNKSLKNKGLVTKRVAKMFPELL